MRELKNRFVVLMLTTALIFGGFNTVTPPEQVSAMTVLITRTGSCYHIRKCGNGTFFSSTLKQAKAMGLRACRKCFPNGEPKDDSGKKKEKKPKITINKTSVILLKGKTVKLKVKKATGKVVWKSSKKSVATVTSGGLVKGKKVGTAYISAKANSQTKKCKVKVEDPKFKKTSITVDLSEEYIYLDIKGCNHEADWYSSDEDVVYVDEYGELELVGAGTATVTAKVHGKKLKCKVTVVGDDDDDDYDDDDYDDDDWYDED